GIAAIAGRTIAPDDDRRGATETVAAISDAFWARHFDRSAAAIGATLHVNETPVRIVGVNPSTFTGGEVGAAPDLSLPLTAQPLVAPNRYIPNGSMLDDPDYWWVLMMGRLRAGVSHRAAERAMDAVFQRGIDDTLGPRPDRDRPSLRVLGGSRGQDNLRE